jgi:hypothetical protein
MMGCPGLLGKYNPDVWNRMAGISYVFGRWFDGYFEPHEKIVYALYTVMVFTERP